jgi:hypothetical protein
MALPLRRRRPGPFAAAFAAAAVLLLSSGHRPPRPPQPPVARVDFAVPDRRRWKAVGGSHDISALTPGPDGLVITIGGEDPYFTGPPLDLPAGRPLWLRLRLRAPEGGIGQVFYFRDAPTEAASTRFPVRAAKEWQEIRVPLPPLGPGTRLRFDPPGTRGGQVVLASLTLEARPTIEPPAWPAPVPPPRPGADAVAVMSGALTLRHAPAQWGGWELSVAGQPMAVGWTRPLVGYTAEGGDGGGSAAAATTRWIDVARRATVRVRRDGAAVVAEAAFRDPDGATWEIRQRFAPGGGAGDVLDVETRVTVDADRDVVFLPLFVTLPGAGSFGTAKGQGLFAGVEYLDDEPSSSEADLIGPASRRRVPHASKITFPLMAIQARNRYVGLLWEKAPDVAAWFDSPDRMLGGGGHVMGLLFPGARPEIREDGSVLPYGGKRLEAGRPLETRARLIGGRGGSVVPAVDRYVALRGLPPLPRPLPADPYALLAAGWLDSRVRGEPAGYFRHAFPGPFGPQPAADAAVAMDWLAGWVADAALRGRLRDAARAALVTSPVPT